jgi:hypothetical protein
VLVEHILYIHYLYKICLSFLYDVLVVAITAVVVDVAVAAVAAVALVVDVAVVVADAMVAFVYILGYNVVDYLCRDSRDY